MASNQKERIDIYTEESFNSVRGGFRAFIRNVLFKNWKNYILEQEAIALNGGPEKSGPKYHKPILTVSCEDNQYFIALSDEVMHVIGDSVAHMNDIYNLMQHGVVFADQPSAKKLKKKDKKKGKHIKIAGVIVGDPISIDDKVGAKLEGVDLFRHKFCHVSEYERNQIIQYNKENPGNKRKVPYSTVIKKAAKLDELKHVTVPGKSNLQGVYNPGNNLIFLW